MASGDTGNVVPGNRLRVRLPCPPLYAWDAILVVPGVTVTLTPAIQAGDPGRDAILVVPDASSTPAFPARGGAVPGRSHLTSPGVRRAVHARPAAVVAA